MLVRHEAPDLDDLCLRDTRQLKAGEILAASGVPVPAPSPLGDRRSRALAAAMRSIARLRLFALHGAAVLYGHMATVYYTVSRR